MFPTSCGAPMWGTDATRFYTKADGWCWFFVALDHRVSDVVGWHVAKKGDRWAALEPVRQGVRTHMAGYTPRVALGLGLRHDWGPQYTAHQFQGRPAKSPSSTGTTSSDIRPPVTRSSKGCAQTRARTNRRRASEGDLDAESQPLPRLA